MLCYVITYRVYESMQALPPYLMDDVHLYSIENLINVSLCLSAIQEQEFHVIELLWFRKVVISYLRLTQYNPYYQLFTRIEYQKIQLRNYLAHDKRRQWPIYIPWKFASCTFFLILAQLSWLFAVIWH